MRAHRFIRIAVFMMVTTLPVAAESAPRRLDPAPYVTVYRDPSVAFQVRRDRIRRYPEQVYSVWLRWLWAKPQPHKGESETARIVIGHVDCGRRRVRELAVLHKDQNGKIFDAEEVSTPDAAPWRSFETGTGAAAAVERLCEFLPELSSTDTGERRK